MKTQTIYIISIFLCIALSPNALGQIETTIKENANPFSFTGKSNLYSQYASRPGNYQQLPASSLVWDFNATLFVYGIPVSSNFMLSTAKGIHGQPLNRFGISLAGSHFKEKVPFLRHFSRLNFGTSTPRYSSLVLNGLAVSGVDIEFNPGQFYLAVTSGKTKNIYAEHLNLIPHSSQKILAGKLGVGKKNKTHLYLTAMHVWDQQDREPTEADSIQHRDNYIVGTDAKLSLFKNKFTLQGEFMTSFYSRDKNSTALDQEDVDYIPSWLYDQMKPTISSTLDFAYSASSAIKLRNTSFSANIRKVGPSFKSLGVPYLRNDELKYQLRFNQNFWNKRITAGAWYRRGQDNLIPWKQSTSISTSFGFDVTVKPSKRAYVKLSYSPYFVNNYSDNELYQVNTKTSIASVVTGVNTQFGETRSNTNLLISYQNNQSNARTGLYSVFSCSVNQNISLKKPFSFSGNILYNRIRHNEQLNEIYLFDLNSTYTTKKRWRNRLGIRVSFDESTDNKIGFYLNSSYPIRKNLKINFQARQNYYNINENALPNQNETIFRLGVNASW